VIGYVDPVTNCGPKPDAAAEEEIKLDDIKLEVVEKDELIDVFENDDDIDILEVSAQLLVIGYVDPVINDDPPPVPNPDAAADAEIKVGDIKLEVLETEALTALSAQLLVIG